MGSLFFLDHSISPYIFLTLISLHVPYLPIGAWVLSEQWLTDSAAAGALFSLPT
jgi:hypothetical protein